MILRCYLVIVGNWTEMFVHFRSLGSIVYGLLMFDEIDMIHVPEHKCDIYDTDISSSKRSILVV